MKGVLLAGGILAFVVFLTGCGPKVENGVIIEKDGWFGMDDGADVPEMGAGDRLIAAEAIPEPRPLSE